MAKQIGTKKGATPASPAGEPPAKQPRQVGVRRGPAAPKACPDCGKQFTGKSCPTCAASY